MARNDFGIVNVDIKTFPLPDVSNDFVYRLPPHSATFLQIALR
jgi:hypothetical protein